MIVFLSMQYQWRACYMAAGPDGRHFGNGSRRQTEDEMEQISDILKPSAIKPDSVKPEPAKSKSVQQYIDEYPVWADGTATPTIPLTRMQWRIWRQAAAGKFFEGMVVFMTGVALPLVSKSSTSAHGSTGLSPPPRCSES